MDIGIIGSGNIGSALSRHLKNLGHNVVIANSRGPESLGEIAARTGAVPVTVEEAAGAKDLIIIAIPEKAIENLPIAILSASMAIIVDAGNFYPSRDGHNDAIENGLTDSEWVSGVIGHPVVKAFNNILASSLVSKALPPGRDNRIALSVAGDHEQEKRVIMELIDSIGFDTVEGGALSQSWRQQPGEQAYCQDLDKEALKAALQNADLSQRATNRAKADEQARPYF